MTTTAHKWQTSLTSGARASLNIPDWLSAPPSVTAAITAYHRIEAENREAGERLGALKARIPEVEIEDIRAESAAIKAGKPAPKTSKLDAHLVAISKAEGSARAHQHAKHQAENELLQAIFDARPTWQETAQADANAATEQYRVALAALHEAAEKLNRARSVVDWLDRITTQHPMFRKTPINGYAQVAAFLDQLAVDQRPDTRNLKPSAPLAPDVPAHLVDRMTRPESSVVFGAS